MSHKARRAVLYLGAVLVVGLAFTLRETPVYTKVFGSEADRKFLEREEDRLARKAAADVRVLVIGNSHVIVGEPVIRLEELFKGDGRDETLYWELSSAAQHPEGHLRAEHTMRKVEEGGWDVVILQGVMYSTSGKYEYPLEKDVELCEAIFKHGDASLRLLLFPEWKQRGNDGEEVRAQEACEKLLSLIGRGEIVPVGFAWERVLDAQSNLALHDSDGNHASEVGAYLTACTWYAAITGRDPRGLPAPDDLKISEAERTILQAAAWEAVRAERVRTASDE